MDMVAKPLSAVLAELDSFQTPYRTVMTVPSRRTFPLVEDQLYVIRQQLMDDGVWQLTVAAKMGKERSAGKLQTTEQCVASGACVAARPAVGGDANQQSPERDC